MDESFSLEQRQRPVVVVGSTGSIGTQTLDVVRQHPEALTVVGLAAYRDVDGLAAQARAFGVSTLALGDDSAEVRTAAEPLAAWAREAGGSLRFGRDAVIALALSAGESEAASGPGETPIVVNALVGAAGLAVSAAVLAAGRPLALANKESLVVGGDLLMPMATQAARETGRRILVPIDSEHGAIFQCLVGEQDHEVERLWVTASGGPFRTWDAERIAQATPADALAHPTWAMGPKITIDSATMMNKGLEVIEAHHLFAVDYDRISVVIHPESIVHSMVEFIDGSVKAHLGTTDMRIPIQYALSYPARWSAPVAPLDFTKLGALHFEAPDSNRFPCLALARKAGETGGTAPAVLNASDEVAVAAFLSEEISFGSIAACVEAALEALPATAVESLEQLEAVDGQARRTARQWVAAHSA